MKKYFTKYLGVITLLTGSSLLSEAQTISAPVGQPISITNSIDVTGDINMGTTNSLKLGGGKFLAGTASDVFLGLNTGTTATGGLNTFIGTGAGLNTSTGAANFFLGYSAGYDNTLGTSNVFMGVNAGRKNTTASSNVFIGGNAGRENITGIENISIGTNAGYLGTAASNNTFIGIYSGYATTNDNNTFIGRAAGYANTTGSNNTYIGTGAGNAGTTPTLTNATAIGYNAAASTSNTVVLGNGATTITGSGLAAGQTGLRFANVTSATTPTAIVGGNKILTVDGSGNVVLGTLASGTINSVGGPVAEKTWKDQDGYLYNNSTNGVVINGTGLDGNSLIVKGGALFKEVNVKVEGSESWPDYVFKPSYKRMTLDEVEKYININGHLPNVASATEMAATGNNLNKTDIKLLEKVEELTLYLLEMKKSNEAQNAEIQNLKKQVKSLRRK
jgi:trimeric autotransporter adhesin